MYYYFTKTKLIFHCSIIFILIVFLQNKSLLSQESNENCLELIQPKDINELKELRLCIKKINIAKETEKEKQIIQNSFEGSSKLTERIYKGNQLTKIDSN